MQESRNTLSLPAKDYIDSSLSQRQARLRAYDKKVRELNRSRPKPKNCKDSIEIALMVDNKRQNTNHHEG